MTESSPTDGEREPLTLQQLAADTNSSIDFTDWALDALEDRVSAIEEIIAARGMFLRRRLARRLARELRASVAGIDETTAPGVGAGFRRRRAEAAGQWLVWGMIQRDRARRSGS